MPGAPWPPPPRISIITAGVRGHRLRPDLTGVPLHGVEPSQVAPATRAGDRGRLVAALRKDARTHLTGA
ncbi:hypothetical protein ACIBVL_34050 [Streptomyces sp. NPDC049687]|uniref:hypothetical protein n=1 Tax=Streptomyces sp. NPDC049687 TaxID=3365596 RepID=UPI003787846C